MNLQEKRPVIGIITANASQSEQRQLLMGIIGRAQELGARILIFSNIYNSSEYYANVEIENKIYDLIVSHKLDGLILTAEAFLNEELQTLIYNKIISRNDTPVVVTGADIPGFPSVNNDVRSDMRDIVNHLIEVHNFTDIDILTGYYESETSHIRVEGYKDALSSHGIAFDEKRVIFGDFWMSSGESLAMEYISEKRPFPQAIVCANDYAAYGLCDTFLENGISVPEDVTVIGYEYTGERFYHAPVLTTYLRNRKAIGARAFNMLWEMITGIKPEPVSLSGHMIYGRTCSCPLDSSTLSSELAMVRREQYYSTLNLVGNFQQQLTLCLSISDYVSVLQQFAYLIRDIKGLHLCLYENWCRSELSADSTLSLDTETMVWHRVITQKHTTDEPVFFNKYDLYPDALEQSESGDVLFFSPIFFSGRELGYFILQYTEPDCYDIIFRDWLKIAANALETLRMKNDIKTLLECRSLSEYYDSVTGLYNKNGLENELVRSVREASGDECVILILIRSELFSDNSSIDRQDISVRLDMEIAENLKKPAVRKNEFCAKLSHKLYAFVAVGDYPQNYEELLSDKLYTLICHSPRYSESCDTDSVAIVSCRESAHRFSLDDSIKMLSDRLSRKISELSDLRKHSGYAGCLKLRNELCRNPSNKWDAQKSCRDFRLSYGHFRAIYKELFGISFHQDVIRSRISYAKFLLMTTALSVPSIAYKCGYEDDKYFMRQFRQLTGMTPNVYRSGGSE